MNVHQQHPAVLDLEPDRSPVRITSPGELVASIPAIFGFQPSESLVGILLTAQSALACSLRIDLAEGLPEAAEVVAHACPSADADHAVIVIYTDAGTGAMPHADAVAAMVEQLARQGIQVLHAFLVDEPHFWAYGHPDTTGDWLSHRRVIPAESTELQRRRSARAVARVAVSREVLEERYRPLPEHSPTQRLFERERAVLDGSLDQRCSQAVHDLRQLQQHGWTPECAAGDGVNAARARLMLLLQDLAVRDHLLAHIAATEDVRAAAEVLSWLALTSPPELLAALAASAATVQYLRGDNPVGTTTLLELAGDQRLARLLGTWIRLALPPQDLREALLAARSRLEAHATAP
jgi:hypothetical protein